MTYANIAKKNDLEPRTTKRYVAYMKARWLSDEATNCECGYADEWARRFKEEREWEASDIDGQEVLISMGL